MVVAVLMGIGIGWLLKNLTETTWTFWIGVFIGVAAAILNVYKAYSKQYKVMQELSKEPRYAIKKQMRNEDEDDEDYGGTKYSNICSRGNSHRSKLFLLSNAFYKCRSGVFERFFCHYWFRVRLQKNGKRKA
jgi:high-affinity Fe2+/Pb2+ permease